MRSATSRARLYSYSFALNPDWSKVYSPQQEIWAYTRKVAERSGTLDRFVFDTAVLDAAWDEDAQRWIVRTEGPDGTKEYAARTVISGSGGLSEPRLPEIEGIEDFQGEIFHSARWDHDVDLAGKRVAVIGTGASAVQARPRACSRSPATWTSTSAPRTGSSPATSAPSAAWRRPSSSTSPASSARCAVSSTARSRRGSRRSPGSRRLMRAVEPAGQAQHRQGHHRPGAAGEGHPGLPGRLQADPDLQQVVPRARRRQRRPGHRPDCQGHRRRGRHRGRRGAADRRARGRHRLLRHRAADRPAHHRPGGPHAGRRLGRGRHGGVQGDDHPRLPQPVPDRRAEHRARSQQHDLHHRVPGPLRRRGSQGDAPRGPRGARADAGRAGRVDRPDPPQDEAHRVADRRLREPGTSTSSATTPRSGRDRRSRSGSTCPSSTSTSTTSGRPTPPRRHPPRRRSGS
ncbi:NAD(P)/FAD-dependent oxidoreductase [Nocardioides convexus]|uniref:SidA/IucD/PvdA family monooxygenase n=1 Tax=Nocardioides convexus TaxID=2712224 RepID=UPI0024181E77|nr:NAD(P)/FAD-dependent oxidoreductase [Nocardioides convexus]